MTVKQGFVIVSVLLLLIIVAWTAIWQSAAWLFIPVVLLILLGIYDVVQRWHTVLRLF